MIYNDTSQQKTALQSLCRKNFKHYDKVKEITGGSTATGHLAHWGTKSTLSPPSCPDQDEQEDPQSLGNVISGITGQSQLGLANVISINTAFSNLLSTSAFTDTLTSDTSGPLPLFVITPSPLPPSIITPGPLLPLVATSVTYHTPPLSASSLQPPQPCSFWNFAYTLSTCFFSIYHGCWFRSNLIISTRNSLSFSLPPFISFWPDQNICIIWAWQAQIKSSWWLPIKMSSWLISKSTGNPFCICGNDWCCWWPDNIFESVTESVRCCYCSIGNISHHEGCFSKGWW